MKKNLILLTIFMVLSLHLFAQEKKVKIVAQMVKYYKDWEMGKGGRFVNTINLPDYSAAHWYGQLDSNGYLTGYGKLEFFKNPKKREYFSGKICSIIGYFEKGEIHGNAFVAIKPQERITDIKYDYKWSRDGTWKNGEYSNEDLAQAMIKENIEQYDFASEFELTSIVDIKYELLQATFNNPPFLENTSLGYSLRSLVSWKAKGKEYKIFFSVFKKGIMAQKTYDIRGMNEVTRKFLARRGAAFLYTKMMQTSVNEIAKGIGEALGYKIDDKTYAIASKWFPVVYNKCVQDKDKDQKILEKGIDIFIRDDRGKVRKVNSFSMFKKEGCDESHHFVYALTDGEIVDLNLQKKIFKTEKSAISYFLEQEGIKGTDSRELIRDRKIIFLMDLLKEEESLKKTADIEGSNLLGVWYGKDSDEILIIRADGTAYFLVIAAKKLKDKMFFPWETFTWEIEYRDSFQVLKLIHPISKKEFKYTLAEQEGSKIKMYYNLRTFYFTKLN